MIPNWTTKAVLPESESRDGVRRIRRGTEAARPLAESQPFAPGWIGQNTLQSMPAQHVQLPSMTEFTVLGRHWRYTVTAIS